MIAFTIQNSKEKGQKKAAGRRNPLGSTYFDDYLWKGLVSLSQ